MTAVLAGAVRAPVDAGRRRAADVSSAGALVAIRVTLWIAAQLLVAGVILLAGAARADAAFNAAAGWWMVYGSLVDLGTLAAVFWILRRTGASYRDILAPRARVWQTGLGVVAMLVATVPAVFFSAELTIAMFGTDTPPMLALVDVPALASAFSILVWPALAELAEPVAYLGIVLPALERRLGRPWLAATIVVAVWSIEHAFFPMVLAGGGIDAPFAAYRVLSVLPFLAIWTALYYAFGRRLLPLMIGRWIFNGGTALAVGLGWTG
jgi:hypothetical protein